MSSTYYPHETNGIGDLYSTPEGRDMLHEANENRIHWTDPRLVKFDRFRMLTDYTCPYWDISYVRGIMNKDGKLVYCRVQCDLPDLKKKIWWSQIKAAAREQGVNIYKLKLWDSISKLW